jgi:CPA1 family monovalent cation:H+ antiporter
LLDRLEIDLNFFQQDPEEIKSSDGNTLSNYQRIYLDLLDQQRKLLYEMNHREEFSEDLIRKYLSLIDIEEYKVRENLL